MAILKNITVTGTSGIKLPQGTTEQRPINIYNTPGSYSWVVPLGITSISVLVVGAGGSGGGNAGGGGAGGRVIEQVVQVTPGQSATIYVGAGGSAPSPTYSSHGQTGETSSFNVSGTIIECLGGNGGNGRSPVVAPNTGWNGGGSSYESTTGTAGLGGFAGGNGNGIQTETNGNGGGGGASGQGQSGFSDTNGIDSISSPPFGGGNGGHGQWSSISGAPEVYAGGGGGSYNVNVDAGWAGKGTHGGGNGGTANVTGLGTDGRSGYGCGGGGGPTSSANPNSGLGGDGCVIINWAIDGSLRYNTDFNEVEMWNGYMYVNSQTGTWSGYGKTERTAALSAVYVKENYPQSESGVYWIHPSNWFGAPQQVYCDMETDSGGWMMIAYAGALKPTDSNWPNQKATTAKENTYWLPLFCNWGEITADSRDSGTSFSRPDFGRAVGEAGNNSEFMSYRTGNLDNVLIWSAEDITRFGTRNNINWTFPGAPGLIINKMLMSKTATIGARRLENKNFNRSIYNPGYLFARYENGPAYPGISWNSAFNSNSDGVGGFDTFLNRRSVLYWETLTSGSSSGQWFHASPLQLGPSTGAFNGRTRLDIGFYFRERNPNVRPISILPGMSQDYPAENALEVLCSLPSAPSGLYWIKPSGYSGVAQQIFCDMSEEDGPGWMLVSSNNARDATIPLGTARNNVNYQLNRNGGAPLVGDFGISPEGDYIIGAIITTLPYNYARVVGWGGDDIVGARTFYGTSDPVSTVNTDNRGTWVKAVWSVNPVAGAVRETQVLPLSSVAITGDLDPRAAFFVLDGIKADIEASGTSANNNQTTIGGVGVASSNGDPSNGCYLGHGNTEATDACEGWYDSTASALNSQGYTTWVK